MRVRDYGVAPIEAAVALAFEAGRCDLSKLFVEGGRRTVIALEPTRALVRCRPDSTKKPAARVGVSRVFCLLARSLMCGLAAEELRGEAPAGPHDHESRGSEEGGFVVAHGSSGQRRPKMMCCSHFSIAMPNVNLKRFWAAQQKALP